MTNQELAEHYDELVGSLPMLDNLVRIMAEIAVKFTEEKWNMSADEAAIHTVQSFLGQGTFKKSFVMDKKTRKHVTKVLREVLTPAVRDRAEQMELKRQ